MIRVIKSPVETIDDFELSFEAKYRCQKAERNTKRLEKLGRQVGRSLAPNVGADKVGTTVDLAFQLSINHDELCDEHPYQVAFLKGVLQAAMDERDSSLQAYI